MALLQLNQCVKQGLAKLVFLEAVYVTDELRAMGFLLAPIFQLRLFNLPFESIDLLGIGGDTAATMCLQMRLVPAACGQSQ